MQWNGTEFQSRPKDLKLHYSGQGEPEDVVPEEEQEKQSGLHLAMTRSASELVHRWAQSWIRKTKSQSAGCRWQMNKIISSSLVSRRMYNASCLEILDLVVTVCSLLYIFFPFYDTHFNLIYFINFLNIYIPSLCTTFCCCIYINS